MIISPKMDYALQIVQYLSTQPTERAFSTQMIMDILHVPARHVTQILRRLSRAKILSSRRGLYGGYHLARPGREINYLEVVDAVDGKTARRAEEDDSAVCVACQETGGCAVHKNIDRLQGLLRAQLKEIHFN